MPIRRHVLSAVAATIALVTFAVPAFAIPGVIKQSVNVYAQAGGNGPAVGSVDNGLPVTVVGCAGNWCSVSGGGVSGWVAKSAITFKGILPPANISPDSSPQAPRPNNGNGNGNGNNQGGNGGFNFDFNFGNDNPGPFPPDRDYDPRPPRPRQQAQACFYSATNFRGDSFCALVGDSLEFLPEEWDNQIRSVEITGRARVDLCRNEDFEGACATLRSSQSRLPSQIDRRVSSVEVY